MQIDGQTRNYDNITNCWEYRDEGGLLHRDGDKPAIICNDRISHWKHGRMHRDGDKPALLFRKKEIFIQERVEYYKDGVMHREKCPAVINRIRHREDKEFRYEYRWIKNNNPILYLTETRHTYTGEKLWRKRVWNKDLLDEIDETCLEWPLGGN